MTSPVTCEYSDGIAVVTIDNPPVNATGQGVRSGLLEIVGKIDSDPRVRAVVLRCAGRTFAAGADIGELGKPPLPPFLPTVVEAIENARPPWVAAIHGSALGGGLELCLACTARIADPNAKLGLPEVTLGTIPGAGGTVRLPRLIPLPDAVEMITGGKPVSGARALSLGLINVLSENDLVAEATALAASFAGKPKPPVLLDRPCRNAEDIDWSETEKMLAARARGAAAPLEALEAMKDSARLSSHEALSRERERFLRMTASEQAAALRYAFFSERQAGRSLTSINCEPANLDLVGVVGGGTMGAGIATALLLSGSAVRLLERDAEAARTAHNRVADMIQTSRARGVISRQGADEALARLVTTNDDKALISCALVIEAVFEDMRVKGEVFSRLDAIMPRRAVLATNTSYLDVDHLSAMTADPTRVLGLHFFAPAHVMKLLEVVRGKKTGDRTLATGAALARRLKKIAVVSGVCQGFIGNRIMSVYRRECHRMLLEGALPDQIDAAMRDFGFPMGIFEVQDLSGLDIAWAQRKAAAPSEDSAEPAMRIADRLCELGRLGRKTKKGWYDYGAGEKRVDPVVTLLIEQERAKAAGAARMFSRDEIMRRILRVMQLEGQLILDEGIAECASDIDVVMLTGYGFPRHRGGPMFMGTSEGHSLRGPRPR